MCEDKTQTSLNNISVLVSVYVYLFFGAYVKKMCTCACVCTYVSIRLQATFLDITIDHNKSQAKKHIPMLNL